MSKAKHRSVRSGQRENSAPTSDTVSEPQPVLREILDLLRTLAPTPKTRLERFHDALITTIKYIGLPAAILACVLPVAEIFGQLLEARDRRLMEDVFSNYAMQLLDKGNVQRAKAVVSELEKVRDLNVEAMYYRAIVLASETIRQGRGAFESEDKIRILLKIGDQDAILFPDFGGALGEFELRLLLVDILTQTNRYAEAGAELSVIRNEFGGMFGDAPVNLRQGRIEQLTYNKNAEQTLLSTLDSLAEVDRPNELAHARLYYANVLRQRNSLSEAIHAYQAARAEFSKLGDSVGEQKCLNNIAVSQMSLMNFEDARSAYEAARNLAYRDDDDLGLARALLGLAGVARAIGKPRESIKLSLEAEKAFQKSGNLQGIAAANQNLANTSVRTGELQDALYFGNKALVGFMQVSDIAGLGRTHGVLAEVNRGLHDLPNELHHLIQASVFNRLVLYEDAAWGAVDAAVHSARIEELCESAEEPVLRQVKQEALEAIRNSAMALGRDDVERVAVDVLGLCAVSTSAIRE